MPHTQLATERIVRAVEFQKSCYIGAIDPTNLVGSVLYALDAAIQTDITDHTIAMECSQHIPAEQRGFRAGALWAKEQARAMWLKADYEDLSAEGLVAEYAKALLGCEEQRTKELRGELFKRLNGGKSK